MAYLYLPTGNPARGPKFDYKPRWLERLTNIQKNYFQNIFENSS